MASAQPISLKANAGSACNCGGSRRCVRIIGSNRPRVREGPLLAELPTTKDRRVGKAQRAHRSRTSAHMVCCGGHASLCPPYDPRNRITDSFERVHHAVLPLL